MVLVTRTPVGMMVVMAVPATRKHERHGKRRREDDYLFHFAIPFRAAIIA